MTQQMIEIQINKSTFIIEYDLKNIITFAIMLIAVLIVLSSTWNYMTHYQAPVKNAQVTPPGTIEFHPVTPTPAPQHPDTSTVYQEIQAPGVILNGDIAHIDVNTYKAAGGITLPVTNEYIDNSNTCYPVDCTYLANDKPYQWQENQAFYDKTRYSLVSGIVQDALIDETEWIDKRRLWP